MSLMEPVQVILPVYNEGPALPALLENLRAVLSEVRHDIVVVDDGSTDGAIDALAAQAQADIHIVRHLKNRGLGEAVRTGMGYAIAHDQDGLGIVVVMDADNTQPPSLIPTMLEKIAQGHDVVIASRFVAGASVQGVTLFRQMMSLGASALFRLCVPVDNVRDYTCGYRAYRTAILKKAFTTYRGEFLTESGFTCMADILLKLHHLGARFMEVPLELHYEQKRSVSKMKVPVTVARSLRLIAQHWRR